MGHVYANLTLSNTFDNLLAKRGNIPLENVRKMEVKVLIDSGARTLTINEKIAEQLGLDFLEQIEVVLADGSYRKCDYVGPVSIRFENRFSCCPALVLPGADEILLGVIPLEEMDVLVDPLSEKLIVHPDRPHRAQMKVK